MTKSPVTRITAKVTIHPVGQIATLLADGATPAQLRSTLRESSGLQGLLDPFELDLEDDRPAVPPDLLERLKKTIRQRGAHDPAAPQSAVRVHRSEASWIAAAQRVICTPDWVREPWRARVICATAAEARRIGALLRVDPEPGRGEDVLESAYWLVENLIDPGSAVEHLAPTLLAREARDGDRLGEVFLSAGCWDLSSERLLQVVRATSMGLHVLIA